MNPRDIPERVAELTMEMHEVRSELSAVNGRLDRLQEEGRLLRDDMRTMPEQIGQSVVRALEQFLLKILDHDRQVPTHEQRLTRLENPSA